jgi:FlaA1/EpsC-like NDP-sugar epimerase
MVINRHATLDPRFAGAPARAMPAHATPFAVARLRALDIAALALAGVVALAVVAPSTASALDTQFGRDLLIAAFFGPFVLDHTGSYRPEHLHRLGHLLVSLGRGTGLLVGALLAVRLTIGAIGEREGAWLAAWTVLSLATMSAARAAFWIGMQRRVASGALRETVAIVGADPAALRLAGALGRQNQALEIVGVFSSGARTADPRFAGSLADLVQLGQVRRIDKIIVAAPTSGDAAVHRVIHTLKSLAVDILLAPYGGAGEPIVRAVDRLGGVPMIRVVGAKPALTPAEAA